MHNHGVFKLIVIICLVNVAASCSNKHEKEEAAVFCISLEELISNPNKYDNEFVCTSGYIVDNSFENYLLFRSEEDFMRGDVRYCAYVATTEPYKKDILYLKPTFVIVKGRCSVPKAPKGYQVITAFSVHITDSRIEGTKLGTDEK